MKSDHCGNKSSNPFWIPIYERRRTPTTAVQYPILFYLQDLLSLRTVMGIYSLTTLSSFPFSHSPNEIFKWNCIWNFWNVVYRWLTQLQRSSFLPLLPSPPSCSLQLRHTEDDNRKRQASDSLMTSWIHNTSHWLSSSWLTSNETAFYLPSLSHSYFTL